MYLIVYTGKNANAPQSGNSAEIPISYEFSSSRMVLITATSVPEVAGFRCRAFAATKRLRPRRRVSGVRKAKKTEH
jgi:hypothetical protein